MSDNKLNPTEEEIAYHKNELIPIIQARLGKEDVKKDIDNIIDHCIEGWPKAPKSFAKRIQRKAKLYGTDGEGVDNLTKKRKRTPSKKTDRGLARSGARFEAFTKSYETFASQLNEKERGYFNGRLEFYLSEFDFNMSSDLSLLMQLIMQELQITELQVEMTKIEDFKQKASMAKAIRYITENVIELEKILGITREQRQKGMKGVEGTVAQIAESLALKIKKIGNIEKKEREQEELLLQAKIKRDDINKIPREKSELEKILANEEGIKISND